MSMRRRVYLETFGCQMNVLDSELVLGQLRAQGYESAESPEQADVVIYNTCSVREHAEQKVRSRLGELREYKGRRPALVVAVIGCMAEREGLDLFRKYAAVDIVCGPGQLDKLPGMIHNAVVTRASLDGNDADHTAGRSGRTRQAAVSGWKARRSGVAPLPQQDTLERLDLSRSVSPADGTFQAYVRIVRGCNKFCTYCVVPYARGPEVHRPPDNIVEEVRRLADAGVREITLLGQTVNHYQYQHGDGRKTTFADLLERIHEQVPHLARLRFVTSHPQDFSKEALQVVRDCKRICRYLHLPAQSGSDRILRLMNRGYSARQYVELIEQARELLPDVCVASDFIVGFPSESEEDHRSSLDLIRRCGFKNSFIFKYSPRPGTEAYELLKDDVPEAVKRRRNQEALAVQQEVSEAHNRRMIGRIVEVIVEGQTKLLTRRAGHELPAEQAQHPGRLPAGEATTQLIGRTRGDEIVCFDGNPALTGQIVHVQIVDAHRMTLFGQLVRAGAGA